MVTVVTIVTVVLSSLQPHRQLGADGARGPGHSASERRVTGSLNPNPNLVPLSEESQVANPRPMTDDQLMTDDRLMTD